MVVLFLSPYVFHFYFLYEINKLIALAYLTSSAVVPALVGATYRELMKASAVLATLSSGGTFSASSPVARDRSSGGYFS